MTLTDKVVFLTGASSGIGRALAKSLSHQGAHVALVARNLNRLLALQSELAGCAGERLVLQADVTQTAEIADAVTKTLDRFGRIDVLVNNAGIGQASSLMDTQLDELHHIFETNFFGAFAVLQAVVPHMMKRRTGLVIQLSSLNGFFVVPLGGAYVSSKFAIEALSRTARVELRPHNIRVLVVRPGLTDTDFFNRAKYFRDRDPFSMKQMMSPEEVAEQIVRAAVHERSELILGREGKLLWWLAKLSPRLVDWLATRHAQAYRRRAKSPIPRRSPLTVLPPAPETAPSRRRTGESSPADRPASAPAARPAAK